MSRFDGDRVGTGTEADVQLLQVHVGDAALEGFSADDRIGSHSEAVQTCVSDREHIIGDAGPVVDVQDVNLVRFLDEVVPVDRRDKIAVADGRVFLPRCREADGVVDDVRMIGGPQVDGVGQSLGHGGQIVPGLRGILEGRAVQVHGPDLSGVHRPAQGDFREQPVHACRSERGPGQPAVPLGHFRRKGGAAINGETLVGHGHRVSAGTDGSPELLGHRVERERIGPTTRRIGEGGAAQLDFPHLVPQDGSGQCEIHGRVHRRDGAAARNAAGSLTIGHCDRRGEGARSVFRLDGQRMTRQPVRQGQFHRGPDAGRTNDRDLIGVVVHPRVESGHAAALGVDVGDMRVRQTGGAVDDVPRGDRPVGQVPVRLARHHEGVVQEAVLAVADAAVEGDGTSDLVDPFAHRREYLQIPPLEKGIVGGRDQNRLLPVPGVPLAVGGRENQLRRDRSARGVRRKRHGRSAAGIDFVDGTQRCAVHPAQREDTAGQGGAVGRIVPDLGEQIDGDVRQFVPVTNSGGIRRDAVERQCPDLPLGRRPGQFDVEGLLVRRRRNDHSSLRIRDDRQVRYE